MMGEEESPKTVTIAKADNVVVAKADTVSKIVVAVDNPSSMPASTTAEEDRKTRGQRKINVIWEVTQATIALVVTMTAIFVAACLVLRDERDSAAFLLLSNAFFTIVGFYFGRTNHQKTGGVGAGDAGR